MKNDRRAEIIVAASFDLAKCRGTSSVVFNDVEEEKLYKILFDCYKPL